MRTIERKTTPKAAPASKSAKTRPINFPAETVDLLEELLAASGTNLTVDEYAVKFLQDEITESLVPRSCGVPEILAGSYQLEPQDMRNMESVCRKWRDRLCVPA
jgi:hypothetical protein